MIPYLDDILSSQIAYKIAISDLYKSIFEIMASLLVQLLSMQVSLASVSFLASSFITMAILRSDGGLTSPYRRIIFGLSASDILQSLSLAIGPVMVPAGIWAHGNDWTCRLNGYMYITGSCSLSMYMLTLCFYSVLKTKTSWNMTDAQFYEKIEKKIHTTIFLFTTSLCFAGLVTNSINNSTLGNVCLFSAVPTGCRQNPQVDCDPKIEKSTEILNYISVLGLELSCLTGIVVCMAIICARTIKQSRITRGRYDESNNNLPKSDRTNTTINLSGGSFLNSPEWDPAITNSVESDQLPLETNNNQTLSNSMIESSAMVKIFQREIIIQASLFVFIYLVTYICRWVVYVQLLKGNPASIPLVKASFIFYPLGGFFNIFVYTRPKVSVFRINHPECSWIKAFWLVVKAGNNVPSFHNLSSGDGTDRPPAAANSPELASPTRRVEKALQPIPESYEEGDEKPPEAIGFDNELYEQWGKQLVSALSITESSDAIEMGLGNHRWEGVEPDVKPPHPSRMALGFSLIDSLTMASIDEEEGLYEKEGLDEESQPPSLPLQESQWYKSTRQTQTKRVSFASSLTIESELEQEEDRLDLPKSKQDFHPSFSLQQKAPGDKIMPPSKPNRQQSPNPKVKRQYLSTSWLQGTPESSSSLTRQLPSSMFDLSSSNKSKPKLVGSHPSFTGENFPETKMIALPIKPFRLCSPATSLSESSNSNSNDTCNKDAKGQIGSVTSLSESSNDTSKDSKGQIGPNEPTKKEGLASSSIPIIKTITEKISATLPPQKPIRFESDVEVEKDVDDVHSNLGRRETTNSSSSSNPMALPPKKPIRFASEAEVEKDNDYDISSLLGRQETTNSGINNPPSEDGRTEMDPVASPPQIPTRFQSEVEVEEEVDDDDGNSTTSSSSKVKTATKEKETYPNVLLPQIPIRLQSEAEVEEGDDDSSSDEDDDDNSTSPSKLRKTTMENGKYSDDVLPPQKPMRFLSEVE